MGNQHKYIMPTDEEDTAINAGIAADPDTYESDFRHAIHTTATTPQGIVDEVMAYTAKRRGKQKEPTKIPVSVRLEPKVLEYFKKSGKGWQTRINDALVKAMHEAV